MPSKFLGLLAFLFFLMPMPAQAQGDLPQFGDRSRSLDQSWQSNDRQHRGRDGYRQRGHRGHQKRQRGIEGILADLGLTDEQKEKIKLTTQELGGKERFKELKAKIKTARESFQSVLRNSSASTDELRRKFEELNKVKYELAELRFEKMLRIREVLTPEQRKVFEEKYKGGKGRDRRNKRQGPRQRGDHQRSRGQGGM